MLTTVDNPFDPFTQFDAWYAYDMMKGYYTPSLLARVCVTSHDLSEIDERQAIESAMDDIIESDIGKLYVKVFKEISK